MSGSLVRPKASTTTPLAISSPAAAASSTFGTMPTPITARSASMKPPSEVPTWRSLSPPTKPATPVVSRRSTPCRRCSRSNASPIIRGATRFKSQSSTSSTVTWQPRRAAAAATSSPMKPPPTMVTRAPGASAGCSVRVSSMLRR